VHDFTYSYSDQFDWSDQGLQEYGRDCCVRFIDGRQSALLTRDYVEDYREGDERYDARERITEEYYYESSSSIDDHDYDSEDYINGWYDENDHVTAYGDARHGALSK